MAKATGTIDMPHNDLMDHDDVHTTTPNDGDHLEWDDGNSRWDAVAPSGGSADLKPAQFRDSGSTNIINTASTTVGLDTTDVSDANYSLATSIITVTAAGTYEIAYSCPCNEDGTGGATRTRIYAWVERNPGGAGSFTAIPQSYSQVYVREASGGSGLSASFICELTADDELALEIQTQASTDVSTETGQAQLNIKKVG